MRNFRDVYSQFLVPMHFTGSNNYEFLTKIGRINGMEPSYNFHDLVNILNALNCLSSAEYKENDLKLGRVHNKMKNIWLFLHPFQEGKMKVI